MVPCIAVDRVARLANTTAIMRTVKRSLGQAAQHMDLAPEPHAQRTAPIDNRPSPPRTSWTIQRGRCSHCRPASAKLANACAKKRLGANQGVAKR